MCTYADEGEVCGRIDIGVFDGSYFVFTAQPLEVAELVTRHGAADQVRHADLGFWHGIIPEPTECPELGGAQPCGGKCGKCSTNMLCHGRSFLHPTGFCLSRDVGRCDPRMRDCIDPNERCFTFIVEPEAQSDALEYGVCVPKAQCEGLAARLPGGGRCWLADGGLDAGTRD